MMTRRNWSCEIALHVVVVEMQRVVVEQSVAEQADGFARHRECRPVDTVAGVETFEWSWSPPSIAAGWSSRGRSKSLAVLVEEDVVMHHEQRSRLMNLSSARACNVMTSPGRAGCCTQDCPHSRSGAHPVSAGGRKTQAEFGSQGGAISRHSGGPA